MRVLRKYASSSCAIVLEQALYRRGPAPRSQRRARRFAACRPASCSRRRRDAHAGRQLELDFLDATGLVHAGLVPVDFGELDAVLVLQHAAHVDAGGLRPFRDADPATFQILRRTDAGLRAHVDRRVAEHARCETPGWARSSGACCDISETILPKDISVASHSRNLVKRKKISSIGRSSTASSMPCGRRSRAWSYGWIARVSGRFIVIVCKHSRAMPTIRLPDGSSKSFPEPRHRRRDRAARSAPGLARAALAGKVNGKLVDTGYRVESDADVAIVTERDPEGVDILRHSTAHLLAHAVKELFPDAQVTIGPVIENGFYYDFSYKRPFTPEDLAAIEKRMAEIAKQDLPVQRKVMPRDEAVKFLPQSGREVQGGDHRLDPRERADLALRPGQLDRPVPRAARALDRQAQGVQADARRRRVLARRLEERDAPAHLRHRLGEEGGPGRVPEDARGGREARPPPPRHAARPLPHAGRSAGPGVLASRRAGRCGSRSSSTCGGVYRDNGYQEVRGPQILDRSLWERTGHWDNFRENMFTTSSENRDYAIKPMNCPGPHPDLQQGRAQLPRAAAALRRVRLLPPQRALGRAARPDARAGLHAGRRPHLLHRGPHPAGVRGLHRAAAEGLPRFRLQGDHLQGRDAPGQAHRFGRDLGQGRGRAETGAREIRREVYAVRRAKALSTARRSSTP